MFMRPEEKWTLQKHLNPRHSEPSSCIELDSSLSALSSPVYSPKLPHPPSLQPPLRPGVPANMSNGRQGPRSMKTVCLLSCPPRFLGP